MIVRFIIEFLIGLIPSFTFPVEILGAFTECASWVIAINHYIPINTFFMCLTFYFVSWLACAVTSAILQLL